MESLESDNTVTTDVQQTKLPSVGSLLKEAEPLSLSATHGEPPEVNEGKFLSLANLIWYGDPEVIEASISMGQVLKVHEPMKVREMLHLKIGDERDLW